MGENEPIEQPDVNEQKKTPGVKPEDFGYKKFEPGKHQEAMKKAKEKGDKEGEEEVRRLEAELAGDGKKDAKKIMKPGDLHALDDTVRLPEEGKKQPKKNIEELEKKAFMKIMKALQEAGKINIKAEGEDHVFEFKSLTRDSKEMKPEEVQKLMEHIDQGGNIPPNIEFQFHTSFKKNRLDTEVVDVDYRLNLHQIMRSGLETTLSSLLTLSYAAASTYDAQKAKRVEGGEKQETAEVNSDGIREKMDEMRKQLTGRGLEASVIQTGQWQALNVVAPEKQKQFTVVYDGNIFQLTEKRLDKTVEINIATPSEVLQYIDRELK